MEVIRSGKHSSLLLYGNNYCCKKFYSTGPAGGSFFKLKFIDKSVLPEKLGSSFFSLLVFVFRLRPGHELQNLVQ